MSERVPLETQTGTYFDRKHVAIHVPSLSSFAAYRGRSYLDEFDLENETVDRNYSMKLRSKLSQREIDFLEDFFLDMRARVPKRFVDCFWLKMCIATEYNDLRQFFLSFPFPDMSWYSKDILFSYIAHFHLPEIMSDTETEKLADSLGFLLLCTLRLSLKRDSATVSHFNKVLTDVVLKIKSNSILLKSVLSKVLLAFPFKCEREFLVSLGADVNLVSMFADDQPCHPLIVAAGTGNYDYVRETCSTLSGAFNVPVYNESCHYDQLMEDESYTPLTAAIEANDIDMVKMLISLGVYTAGSFSCPPPARRMDIGVGLTRGHYDILRIVFPLSRSNLSPRLFQYATDVKKARFLLEELHCPYINACPRYYDSGEVITYLVNKGADPNRILLCYNDFQCSRPELDVLSTCLKAETFLGPSKLTRPLINAVLRNDGPLLRALIASSNVDDVTDVSILISAMRMPNIGISDILLRAGADARTMLMIFCGIVRRTDDHIINYRYLQWLLTQHGVSEHLEDSCRRAFFVMEIHPQYPEQLSSCLRQHFRK